MAKLVVTIDGPAASGKSTVARSLAERLNASFLDTGAMYRAVTLAAMRRGVDLASEEQILHVIENTRFNFAEQAGSLKAYVDGLEVTGQIRSPEVTRNARYVASAPKVRQKLVEMQRRFAEATEKVVTEGRDQGTVVFPEADVKFYLTAEPLVRAKRRQAELEAAGTKRQLEQVYRAIQDRDVSDEGRAVGPLRPADDAITVDTTELSIEEVVDKLLAYIEERCSKRS